MLRRRRHGGLVRPSGCRCGLVLVFVARHDVRIADAESGEHLALEVLHQLRVAVVLVVKAQEVQRAVHQQVRDVVLELLALLLGLALGRFQGEHDVAQNLRSAAGGVGVRVLGRQLWPRERQHVGRLVDAAVLLIQELQLAVVAEHDGHFAARMHLAAFPHGTLDDVGRHLIGIGEDAEPFLVRRHDLHQTIFAHFFSLLPLSASS